LVLLMATMALAFIAVVAVATVVIGAFGLRIARRSSDFLVASRTVTPAWNACAISGEFLSASSLLGIAGMVLRDGPDGLWYSLGPAAGYLALLLFVAAPLRRSGAYTVPDFAEFRLRSAGLQRACTMFVLVIGTLYLLPQFQGAGLITSTVVPDLPTWSGTLVAAVLVTATVMFGGMRSITFVQAFQYWLKLTALAVPAVMLLSVYLGSQHPRLDRPAPPQFAAETTVAIKTDVVLQVVVPTTVQAHGTVDGRFLDGPLAWEPGTHTASSGAQLRFRAGDSVPVPVGVPARDSDWLASSSGTSEHHLFGIYSLILAEFLGTMGLPHVLTRFYTNRDGNAARRTTVVVLGLLGAFYLLPTLLGALSRLYVPQLLVSGDTDAAVLLMPTAALGDVTQATVLSSLVAAGAWAALLSTSSGLMVSLAGVISTSPSLLHRGRIRDFRVAAVLAAFVPLGLALVATRMDFSQTVALAFAVSASTFCPLLVLGIWWRGLTDRGAVAGLLVGGGSSAGAVGASLFQPHVSGWLSVLLARPAAVSVPAAFVTMIVVSRLTSDRLLADVPKLMLRLHAPEWVTQGHDRVTELPRRRPTRPAS
jgi:Na+(H+)/acetate symporter ActP